MAGGCRGAAPCRFEGCGRRLERWSEIVDHFDAHVAVHRMREALAGVAPFGQDLFDTARERLALAESEQSGEAEMVTVGIDSFPDGPFGHLAALAHHTESKHERPPSSVERTPRERGEVAVEGRRAS